MPITSLRFRRYFFLCYMATAPIIDAFFSAECLVLLSPAGFVDILCAARLSIRAMPSSSLLPAARKPFSEDPAQVCWSKTENCSMPSLWSLLPDQPARTGEMGSGRSCPPGEGSLAVGWAGSATGRPTAGSSLVPGRHWNSPAGFAEILNPEALSAPTGFQIIASVPA